MTDDGSDRGKSTPLVGEFPKQKTSEPVET